MAKEIAIGKRAKISKAQQQMLLIVFAAAVALGAGLSLSIHFIQQISFNSRVIAVEEQSIASYSNVIKTVGVCQSPRGSIYSDAELKACDPNSIEVSQIPGTLRANILENLAANKALNSVPKESDSGCISPEGTAYTYEQLNQIYRNAEGAEALQQASGLIRKCSALRVIPDALPSFRNEEALLSSLNKVFLITGLEPENISPDNSASSANNTNGTYNVIPLSFQMENGNAGVTATLFRNLERSIREINVDELRLTFSEGALSFSASAQAYYVNESAVNESRKTITAEGQ